jgi:hypothetical protein
LLWQFLIQYPDWCLSLFFLVSTGKAGFLCLKYDSTVSL